MRNSDLEGFVPDQASTALLLVDVINSLDFPGAEDLLPAARVMFEQVAELKAACRGAGIPTIYANDNFGRWQSNFDQLIEAYLANDCPGAPLIRRVLPAEDDYNILKPKHSAFYATPLHLLLEHLGVENLIIAGLSTDRCVAFTAHDAYMRDYRVLVPRDCSAAEQDEFHTTSLDTMERVLKAETAPWRELDLAALGQRYAAD